MNILPGSFGMSPSAGGDEDKPPPNTPPTLIRASTLLLRTAAEDEGTEDSEDTTDGGDSDEEGAVAAVSAAAEAEEDVTRTLPTESPLAQVCVGELPGELDRVEAPEDGKKALPPPSPAAATALSGSPPSTETRCGLTPPPEPKSTLADLIIIGEASRAARTASTGSSGPVAAEARHGTSGDECPALWAGDPDRGSAAVALEAKVEPGASVEREAMAAKRDKKD